MSAYVLSKEQISELVKAAVTAYPPGRPGTGHNLSWWRVDEDGNYDGWREVDRFGREGGDEHRQYCSPSELGRMLLEENVKSVNYRYSSAGRASYYGPDHGLEDDDTEYDVEFEYVDPRKDLTPGAVFRAIDCLDYQSCEHPGWRSSEAFSFLRSLRKAYCDRVIEAEEEA